MRILAVNWQDLRNPQAGGAEIHLFEILKRLAAKGHEIALLCSGFSGAAARDSYDGVEVHRTGGRYSFPLHAPGYYRRHLAGTQFDVVVDDINKVPLCTPLWTRGPVVAIVPHLFGTTAFNELPAPLAGIVWLSERPLPRVYRGVRFHAISESTKSDLVRRSVPPASIRVIYPGIDSSHFTPDPSSRSATPLFAYLGRLKRYKGVDLVLRAFATLAIPEARLEIAGSGDYRPQLERLAASLDLGDRVSFLGFVSEERKLDLLRRSWSLVFTSPKEGWGITNLEAQACGTPVIASDSPGLSESVRGDSTGMLVPHGDVQLLAQAMEKLARSRRLVEEMGARGRQFAETFSWERTAEETESHILEALNQSNAGGTTWK